MTIIEQRIDNGRVYFKESFLECLDQSKLRLLEDTAEVRRGWIHKYVDFGKPSHKKLNFLKLADNFPEKPGIGEQKYASKIHPVELKKEEETKKIRITLSEKLKKYAGIERDYIMVKVEGRNPYIGIWSKKNWEKYDKLEKNNHSA